MAYKCVDLTSNRLCLEVQSFALLLNKTSVSETIRKPPLVKDETALKTKKIKYGENDFQYGRWNS